MADGADFNVKFTGSGAQALVKAINTELEAATNAHTKAIEAWKTVKSKFSLSPGTMEQLNGVDEGEKALDTVEFKKVVTSLQNLISGVGNINATWQGVSKAIDDAVSAYTGNKTS